MHLPFFGTIDLLFLSVFSESAIASDFSVGDHSSSIKRNYYSKSIVHSI
jgi:hypothetical protein